MKRIKAFGFSVLTATILPITLLSSCSRQDDSYSIQLVTNNSPISINKNKANPNQNFEAILSTIKSNIISVQNIQINNSNLNPKSYTFNDKTNVLIINKDAINGDIKIFAYSKLHKFNVSKSDDSAVDVNFSCDPPIKNVEFTINLTSEQPIQNYYIKQITVGNNLLDLNFYFFDMSKSQIRIMGQIITGDVVFDIQHVSNMYDSASIKNEDELIIAGGSIQLYGTSGKYGQDEKKWKVYLNSTIDVTKDSQMYILGSSGNIKITSDGNVNWSQLSHGIYHFQIYAAYYVEPSKKITVISPDISLIITSDCELIGGENELNGTLYYPGRDNKPWKLIYQNVDVSDNTVFTLSNQPNGVVFSSENHIILWNNFLPTGVYEFQLNAHCNIQGVQASTSTYITLKINANFHIDNGSELINNEYMLNNRDYKYWSCFFINGLIKPKWEIVNDNTHLIYINNDGLVHWNKNLPRGNHTFNVKCTYENNNHVYEALSNKITLKI